MKKVKILVSLLLAGIMALGGAVMVSNVSIPHQSGSHHGNSGKDHKNRQGR